MSRSSTEVGMLYELFLRECAMYKRSECTIRSYVSSKKMLFNMMPGSKCTDISSLDKRFATEYTFKLSERGISTASVNHYLRDFRAFIYYCMENSYLLPYKCKLLKERENVKEAYSNAELKVLLRKPDNNDNFSIWRTWAIINLILSFGSRAATVANILKEDVDFKQNRLLTRYNKNGKVNAFPLNEQIRKVLLDYRKHIPEREELFFFPSSLGGKISTNALGHSVAKYNKKRGITKSSIHLFRHTYGKLWAENGGGVYELQNIFGHSDIRITQKYINLYCDKDGMPKLTINPLKILL